MIAERPRTTEELAHLVGLSAGGTSKNLGLLAEMGLVRRRRDGYYVLYELEDDALETVSEALFAYVCGGDRETPCETMGRATEGAA